MAFQQIIAEGLADCYSADELRGFQRAILGATMAPESLTGEQLDGVSFSFQPRSLNELLIALANIKSAIAIIEGTTAESIVRSRFIDMSTRPIE